MLERDNYINTALREKIEKAFLLKGWKRNGFELLGIRWEEDQDQDIMNDLLVGIDDDDIVVVTGSTDPGIKYASKTGRINKDGTAHLCYGRYPDVYMIGMHGSGANKHEAFCQAGDLTVWRDFDGNLKYNIDGGDRIVTGNYFGVNLHANLSTVLSKQNKIGGWSAGCQITSTLDDLKKLLAMAKKSKKRKFTYSLLSKDEIKTLA